MMHSLLITGPGGLLKTFSLLDTRAAYRPRPRMRLKLASLVSWGDQGLRILRILDQGGIGDNQEIPSLRETPQAGTTQDRS